MQGGSAPHKHLLFEHNVILAHTPCIEHLGYLGDRVHENTVCTDSPVGSGLCDGDFGGPLIRREDNVLIGLGSWVRECGTKYPDVYTRVFSHLEFIREAIEN